MYTADKYLKVVAITESGKIIARHFEISNPMYFGDSNDNFTYLAEFNTGVYQSTDDGISWSLILNSTDGMYCEEVVKVTTNISDDFWIKEWNDYPDFSYYL